MKFLLIIFVLIFSLFLETTFINLPFVLIIIFLFAVTYKGEWIFPFAVIGGVFLDILSFKTVGLSSLFFMLMLGVVFLYQRKYEIQSPQFIVIFSFVSVFVYQIIFKNQYIFWGAFLTSILSVAIFGLMIIFNTKNNSNILNRF